VIVEALIQLLLENGKEITIGDSNGGTVSLQKVWEKTGMADLASRYPIRMVSFANTGVGEIKSEDMIFPVAQEFLDADAVINIAKYKTHAMMRYTGAIKNFYGLIPGLKKSEYHKLYPETAKFAGVLAKLYAGVKHKVVLHLVDGILGMEGEGPSAGLPRKFGVLFISESASALDYVASRMMGFDWRKLPLIEKCLQLDGLLPSRIEVSAGWQDFQFANVKLGLVSMSSRMLNYIPGFAKGFLRKQMEFYPDFADTCRLCQVCVKSCPVHAISFTSGDKHPLIDYGKCIKCLCCHELCPYHAIYIHQSGLARMFFFKTAR
jgi:uncharacterized protein (DUF362 family)/Pyruvate/2-oxoacid:ferredoxin oxidoreductase delta subunit